MNDVVETLEVFVIIFFLGNIRAFFICYKCIVLNNGKVGLYINESLKTQEFSLKS